MVMLSSVSTGSVDKEAVTCPVPQVERETWYVGTTHYNPRTPVVGEYSRFISSHLDSSHLRSHLGPFTSVHLTSVHLTLVHLNSVHLILVQLASVPLI